MKCNIILLSGVLSLMGRSYSVYAEETLPPDTLITLVDKTAAIAYVEKGKTFYNEGRYNDGILQFKQAMIKDPKNWKGAYGMARCYYQLQNYSLSMQFARESLRMDKDAVDEDVFELLGKSYHRLGHLDSAMINYNKAIALMSSHRVTELQLDLKMKQCVFAKKEIAKHNPMIKKDLGSVNSIYNDYCPILTNGGKAIYFVSRRADKKGTNINPDDQDFFEDTYHAVWNDKINDWDSITNEISRINSNGFDAVSYISKDGLHGLMTINTTAVKSNRPTKSSDLFTIEMSVKHKWSSPKRINSSSINTSFFEGSATMTDDLNTMYFVTDRKGDKSATDIYVTFRTGEDDEWSEALPLPPSINTIGRETTPFITGDGRFLFFSSDGLEGMGGYDIYVAENKGDSWGTPINLGGMFNSVNDDTHFQYYPELKKAVMSSLVLGGQKANMDIYSIHLPDFVIPTAP